MIPGSESRFSPFAVEIPFRIAIELGFPVAEAYVRLMAAYVALSPGAVRRFFGLPPCFAQRDTSVVYAGAAFFGLLL